MSPSESSSHEKHGKPQGCHERPLHHRRPTLRACIGLRSPTIGGEHDSGPTLQPVSGTVGPSVFEETTAVHVAALCPPIHMAALPSCALWREQAREKTEICHASVAWDSGLQGSFGYACMGFTKTSGLGGDACMGLMSHTILELRGD